MSDIFKHYGKLIAPKLTTKMQQFAVSFCFIKVNFRAALRLKSPNRIDETTQGGVALLSEDEENPIY